MNLTELIKKILKAWGLFIIVKTLLIFLSPLLYIFSFIIGIEPNVDGFASLIALLYLFGLLNRITDFFKNKKEEIIAKAKEGVKSVRILAIIFTIIVCCRILDFDIQNPIPVLINILVDVFKDAMKSNVPLGGAIGYMVGGTIRLISGIVLPMSNTLLSFKMNPTIVVQIVLATFFWLVDRKMRNLGISNFWEYFGLLKGKKGVTSKGDKSYVDEDNLMRDLLDKLNDEKIKKTYNDLIIIIKHEKKGEKEIIASDSVINWLVELISNVLKRKSIEFNEEFKKNAKEKGIVGKNTEEILYEILKKIKEKV